MHDGHTPNEGVLWTYVSHTSCVYAMYLWQGTRWNGTDMKEESAKVQAADKRAGVAFQLNRKTYVVLHALEQCRLLSII